MTIRRSSNGSLRQWLAYWDSSALVRRSMEPAPQHIITPGCSTVAYVIVVQLLHSVQLSETHGLPHTWPPCPSRSPRAFPKFSSIESAMPSNHLILCCPYSPFACNLSHDQGLFQSLSVTLEIKSIFTANTDLKITWEITATLRCCDISPFGYFVYFLFCLNSIQSSSYF